VHADGGESAAPLAGYVRPTMRLILFGLLVALVVYALSGGHVLLLPLLFLLPLGGGLFHRRTRRW
jgi:hypothetical protein